MTNKNTTSGSLATRTRRSTARLAYWTLAWLISSAFSTFGPKLLWDYASVPSILAVLVYLATGFGMIMATRRHIQSLDEMHQRIFMDAGALSLGVGLVCGLGYQTLANVKLIAFEPEIPHLVILMSLTFLVGMIAGHRKYQ